MDGVKEDKESQLTREGTNHHDEWGCFGKTGKKD